MKGKSISWTSVALLVSLSLNAILYFDKSRQIFISYTSEPHKHGIFQYLLQNSYRLSQHKSTLRRDESSPDTSYSHGYQDDNARFLNKSQRDSLLNISQYPRQLDEFQGGLPLSEIGKEVDISIFQDLEVIIVFYAYLSPGRNWWHALEAYCGHILDTGLLERANRFYISISTNTNQDWYTDFSTKEPPSDHLEAQYRMRNATIIFDEHLGQYKDKIYYDVTLGNVFEFPGLKRMWDIAHECPDDKVNKTIVLYFHSKGIALHGQISKGQQMLNRYFYNTVGKWKHALKYFVIAPTLNVACTDMMPEGFCNGNHMWARASFLRTVKRPKRSNDRYYYEHWLGIRETDPMFTSSRYALNYDYVQFNESFAENWRYGYLNGNLQGYWDISRTNDYIPK